MHIKILFLGQCIATGAGVRIEHSYPMLIQQQLRLHYPGINFQIVVQPLRHPQGLAALLKTFLREQPDLLFLSLPGLFASLPSRVNLLYHQAPDVIPLARAFLQKLQERSKHDSLLRRLLGVRSKWIPWKIVPPLSLSAYEETVREALVYCQTHSACRVLVMGPGGFNEYSEDGNQTSPELATALNQMLLRVTQEMKMAFINAHELMAEQTSDVYLTASHRWSEQGHAIVARAMESIIAAEITKAAGAEKLTSSWSRV